MNNQKSIELKQRLTSLELANSNLYQDLENQRRNVRMLWLVVVISFLGLAIGFGLIALPFAIYYLVKAIDKRDNLELECTNSNNELVANKNELISMEYQNS